MLRTILAGLGLALALPCGSAGAQRNSFTEDFTTTAHRDHEATTATWDTGAGELRMPPFAPWLAGEGYGTPGEALEVMVVGSLAYVATTTSLQIIDVANPQAPQLRGELPLPGYVQDVFVSGGYAYLANALTGLQVVDVRNPAMPQLVAEVGGASGPARAVHVAGRVAYVAADAAGLLIYNISDPASPYLMAGYPTSSAVGLFVFGQEAYVADRLEGVVLVNVREPWAPVGWGSYNTSGQARSVCVSGGHVFVATMAGRLEIFPIGSVSMIGSLPTPGPAMSVQVSGTRAFVAASGSLLIVDVSNPAAPVLAYSCGLPGTAQGVSLSGPRAFVACGSYGLKVVGTGDHSPPAAIGSLALGGRLPEMAVSGSRGYVASPAGLRILDLTIPSSPAVLGTYWGVTATGLDVAGRVAYVGTSDGSLHIVSVVNPAVPSLLGSCAVGAGPVRSVRFASNYVFVLCGTDLVIVEAHYFPTVSYTYPLPMASELCARGHFVYVANGAQGLEILNVAIGPTHLATVPLPWEATAVDLEGNFAYVIAGPMLHIVDVSNPSAPALLASAYAGEGARSVRVSGGRAYVGGEFPGLMVMDVTNPMAPRPTGELAEAYGILDVQVEGEFAFLATEWSGLQVARIAQHEVDGSRNRGQSQPISGERGLIARARLASVQTPGVSWQLSANRGATWQPAWPGGGWIELGGGGDGEGGGGGDALVWRSTHAWAGVNPTAYEVQLEWLYDFPLVTTVGDIPYDQGRKVRLGWLRSGHDFLGDSWQIVQYAVYRRIDVGPGKAAIDASRFDGLDEASRVHALAKAEAGWDYVATVPVRVQDAYALVVPTLKDSTSAGGHWSVFMVSALTATPGIFFDSPPDSGQSVDNLAPSVPGGFTVAYGYGGAGNSLAWLESPDADFRHFRVYRWTEPDFVPSPANLIHLTTGLGWTDPADGGAGLHYKVTAVDFSGNESPAAVPQTITGIADASLPASFALRGNAPNPFNPATVIRYDVPSGGGTVALRIYDLGGRLVRTLVDGRQEPGLRSVVWDGRDAGGKAVPSGTYLLRLTAPGTTQARKLTLAR